ncbi:DEAD/DEAH box helicase [Hyphomicrobium sp. DY-1]|uniref:DEAD/DEAH box helicase n=1 Tax=Hyphomicrobium sp. DY-1 TaxID=3075650 RepID=UPI0039C41061
MINELGDRIWKNTAFHRECEELHTEWLQRELKTAPTSALSDAALIRLLRAAAVLSLSSDDDRRDAAYRIAASSFDLRRMTHPGASAIANVILGRLGNFPAVHLVNGMGDASAFTPLSLLAEEENRRAKNEVLVSGKTTTLTDFQRELWRDLKSGASVGISAPTSAGKSFVVLAHLEERAKIGGAFRAVFLVPSRALITQITDDISTWSLRLAENPVALLTMPLSADMPLPDRSIFVFTQERLHLTQINHPTLSFDLIVVDEAHALAEAPRGILLASALDEALRRSPNAQVLFASPNVANTEVYGSYFGLQGFRARTTTAKAVAQNILFVDSPSARKKLVSIRSPRSERGTTVAQVELAQRPTTTSAKLISVSLALGGGAPSLVYANGPDVAEKIAAGLANGLPQGKEDEALTELADFIEEAVHAEYALAPAIRHRVGFHYGRIPAPVRKAVEIAFSNGSLKYLVTTSTLLQGVNFPAKNLFICDPRQGDTNAMLAVDFWNLAGRAGRLGKEFQGNVFLIDYETWKAKPLDASRAIQIEPAAVRHVDSRKAELLDCIWETNPQQERPKTDGLEGIFTQLLIDLKQGRIEQSLARLSPAGGLEDVEAALIHADSVISLPVSVLQQSPTISAHRQQRLYAYLKQRMATGPTNVFISYIPEHPRVGSAAYKSYSDIFKICHSELLGYPAKDKRHTRFAAIALQWMRGEPLPTIIDAGRKYAPEKKMESHIRGVLHDIEHGIRFTYVRLMTCYIAVLAEVLSEIGRADLVATIPNIPLYLEMGECRKQAVSLMAVGLSRIAASKILPSMPPNLEAVEDVRQWLLSVDPATFNLSTILLGEVLRALGIPAKESPRQRAS